MKRPILDPADRLIVAADFKPGGNLFIRAQVLALADSLAGTGVYLKVGSALRACGYGLIDEIHSRSLQVFADLKLFDTKATLLTDGMLLREVGPEIVTVVCTAGVSAMHTLSVELPYAEVLGVTVPTSHTDADTQAMFGCKIGAAVLRLADLASNAAIDGLVSSPAEAGDLRAYFRERMTINTPAIRFDWSKIADDDQNPDRVMTPAEAIKAGADRIIVGRPIVWAENPRDVVMRILEEIASATK